MGVQAAPAIMGRVGQMGVRAAQAIMGQVGRVGQVGTKKAAFSKAA